MQPCCASPCRVSCSPSTVVDVTPAEPAPPRPYATGGEKTTWAYLAGKYDGDGDGQVTTAEYGRGEKAFANLDQDKDGKITAGDFKRANRMEQFVAQVTVARYFQADENPRDLHLTELEASFAKHDTDGDGDLSTDEFAAARKAVDAASMSPVPPMPKGVDPVKSLRAVVDTDASGSFSLAEMRAHFASRDDDDDGAWKMRPPRRGPMPARPNGPAPGVDAPDFTLEPPEGGKPVTLSSFQGKQAVALIFGSYT